MMLAKTGVVDFRADQVGGQQVRRELDALEGGVEAGRQGADGEGFGQAGDAFEQQVAVGQQTDDQAVDQVGLTDDDFLHFVAQILDEGALCFYLFVQRVDSECFLRHTGLLM
jgi:hypothetical protein